MLKFETGKTAAVAMNTQMALARYDEAIGSAASVTLSFLDCVRNSDLSATEVQKLVQTLHDSTGNIISGRAGMVAAITLLTSIKRRSNQAETDVGCPGPMPWDSTGQNKGMRLVASS